MRIKETKVYTFDELSDKAKERARNWYREGAFQDTMWADATIEDALTIGKLLGIEFDTYSEKLMSGKEKWVPKIWWSGFASQGDGACFEGRYRYARGCVKNVKAHAPNDAWLHRIVDTLAEVQRRVGYKLVVDIEHFGHYCHSGTMRVHNLTDIEDEAALIEVEKALKDFANWIYNQLEVEYTYQSSDDCIDESILANGYEFTEEGKRA